MSARGVARPLNALAGSWAPPFPRLPSLGLDTPESEFVMVRYEVGVNQSANPYEEPARRAVLLPHRRTGAEVLGHGG